MTQRTLGTKRMSLLLFAVLFVTYAFICMTKNCFSSAMVFIVNEGLLTKFETGIITAAFYLFYAVLQIVGGVITDRFHPERFITVGLIGAAISNLIIFFNQNYVVMLVSWVFNACIQFAVWPATFKIVSTMLVKDMRRNALFVITFGNPFGVVFSYVIAAIVSTEWRMNFLISAVGLLVIAILFEVTFRYTSRDLTLVEIENVKSTQTSESTGNVKFIPIMISSGLIIFTVISFVRTMMDIGLKSLTPTMINESYYDVSPTLATALSIIILIAGAIGPCLARIVYPRFIKNEAKAALAFFLIALPMTVCTLFIGKISYQLLVVLLSIVVMMMSAASLFVSSYVATRFNIWGMGATAAGVLNCMASLGIVASNTVFTGIAEAWGWFGTAIIWVSIALASVIMLLVLIPIWTKFLKKYHTGET